MPDSRWSSFKNHVATGRRGSSRDANLQPPAPVRFVVETITACNLRCRTCHLGGGRIRRQGKAMSWEHFTEVADKIAPYAKQVLLFQWGEPLLHPRIFDMIRYVKRFAAVTISTNGNTLTPEVAQRLISSEPDLIIFSLDGMDRETYESFRQGGDFTKALAGLRNLVAARSELQGRSRIVLQFIVLKGNEGQLRQVESLAKSLNVYLSLKSPYVPDLAMAKEYLPRNPTFRRYEVTDDGLALKFDRFGCREAWKTFYVLVNGDVNPCCHDYNATLLMGNLLEQPLMDIWLSERYVDFRRAFLEHQELPAMCREYCNEPPVQERNPLDKLRQRLLR